MGNYPANSLAPAIARSSNAESVVDRIAPGIDPDGIDPSHHLWRNGRLWWIAFTVHRGHLQERVRFSLKTDDVEQARRRRDEIFALFESAADCRISIRLKTRGTASAGREIICAASERAHSIEEAGAS